MLQLLCLYVFFFTEQTIANFETMDLWTGMCDPRIKNIKEILQRHSGSERHSRNIHDFGQNLKETADFLESNDELFDSSPNVNRLSNIARDFTGKSIVQFAKSQSENVSYLQKVLALQVATKGHFYQPEEKFQLLQTIVEGLYQISEEITKKSNFESGIYKICRKHIQIAFQSILEDIEDIVDEDFTRAVIYLGYYYTTLSTILRMFELHDESEKCLLSGKAAMKSLVGFDEACNCHYYGILHFSYAWILMEQELYSEAKMEFSVALKALNSAADWRSTEEKSDMLSKCTKGLKEAQKKETGLNFI